MIKACIFDLDGVIVDTAHYHFLAWRRLAKEMGIDLTMEDNEKLKGVSRMDSLDIILRMGNIKVPSSERLALADKKNTWFVEYVNQMKPNEIFPGVRELIEKMRSRGLKIGLASSSKNAMTVLHLLQIEEMFDAIVDGNMISRSKPDPEIFLQAAKKLNVPPEDCLVFEDAEAGVAAALAAGMKCVGVGSADQLGKANIVVKNTSDFNLQSLQLLAVE